MLIDAGDLSGDRLRLRALYAFGWAFIFIEFLNLAAILATKSVFSVEAAVCGVVIGAVLLALVSLRWRVSFTVYAVGAGILSVGAPLATAVYDYTGVNSALLPMMVASPMLVGFIGGPRLSAATGTVGILVIGFLYYVSGQSPLGVAPQEAERNLQRAIHAASGIFLVSVTATVISANAFRTLRRLEENVARAQKAEAARTEFLATMSHELRTPMNGVLGLADALARADLNLEDRETVETIRRSGQSLMRILNDILDLSKIDARKVELAIAPFSPHELARDITAQWKESASAKGVHLHTVVDAGTPAWLAGDAQRIEQIIANLVSNAVKFTQAGPVTLVLGGTAGADGMFTLRVAVRDNGPGVPLDARDRIFDVFEQADSGVSRTYGGTGLGLAISRRLAGLMGGTLTLADAGPGATFIFEAPFRLAEAPRAAPPMIAATQELDVLVIDDNAVNRMVAAKLLGTLGHRSEVAESGPAGLALLAQRRFDIVLMDKQMPGMSGVEALVRIRSLTGPAALTCVIACTADTIGGERETLMAAGFDEFLAKPLSAQGLAACLDSVMDAARNPARMAAIANGDRCRVVESELAPAQMVRAHP